MLLSSSGHELSTLDVWHLLCQKGKAPVMSQTFPRDLWEIFMEHSKSMHIPVLIGGEYFTINYSALLDAEEMWHGRVLTLPAKLTFRSSSQVL